RELLQPAERALRPDPDESEVARWSVAFPPTRLASLGDLPHKGGGRNSHLPPCGGGRNGAAVPGGGAGADYCPRGNRVLRGFDAGGNDHDAVGRDELRGLGGEEVVAGGDEVARRDGRPEPPDALRVVEPARRVRVAQPHRVVVIEDEPAGA